MNPDQREELKIKFAEIKAISQSIRDNNATGKTTGGKYPINIGYSTSVRRPIRDILKWISGVELILETMLEEAE